MRRLCRGADIGLAGEPGPPGRHPAAGVLAVALGGLTLGLPSCNAGPSITPPGETRTTRHFAYHYASGDPAVTDDLLERLEAHHDAFFEFFALTTPSARIDYTKYPDRDSFDALSPCSPAASACFFRELGLFTVDSFSRHELVHAYLADEADSHRLLEEGLAVALACDAQGEAPAAIPWEEAFSSEYWGSASVYEWLRLYRAGAHFVAFTLRAYGAASFLDIYRSMTPTTEPAAADAAARAAVGAPLPLIWEGAQSETDPLAACVELR